MPDLEKVIKGLECCMKWTGEPNTATCHCSDCSYTNMDILGQRCLIDLINDALSLLKEQKAVKPILEQDSMVCGVCGHEVIWQKMLGDGIWADEELDYCPHCGRKVKWDDI